VPFPFFDFDAKIARTEQLLKQAKEEVERLLAREETEA